MNKIIIYTDGACSGNPGPGGYAAIIILSNNKEIHLSGGEESTTNNRMEMMGLITSLEYIKKEALDSDSTIEYHIDSQYLIKGVTEWMPGWKKKNWKSSTGLVKNRDLWEKIDTLIIGLNISWNWVKGHNDDTYNELADTLARAEVERYQ